MRVFETMSREVRLVHPDQTLQDAARAMSEIDAGALPVGENDRIVGMITDRDIAVRAVALGMGPGTSVREVMTSHVHCCFEDEDTDEVAHRMADLRVRRMPVMSRNKQLVGILSLGDLATVPDSAREAGHALSDISRPGGAHSH